MKTLITKQLLQALGETIALGHKKFGKVTLPRKPYKEDDGGEGGAQLLFESHPFFADQPQGAMSDLLAADVTHYSEALDAATERADQACPQLQQQPALQQALAKGVGSVPSLTVPH